MNIDGDALISGNTTSQIYISINPATSDNEVPILSQLNNASTQLQNNLNNTSTNLQNQLNISNTDLNNTSTNLQNQINNTSTNLQININNTSTNLQNEINNTNTNLNNASTQLQNEINNTNTNLNNISAQLQNQINSLQYLFQASSSTTEFTISHNLNNMYVDVTCYDQNNNIIMPDNIQVLNANQVYVIFDYALQPTIKITV